MVPISPVQPSFNLGSTSPPDMSFGLGFLLLPPQASVKVFIKRKWFQFLPSSLHSTLDLHLLQTCLLDQDFSFYHLKFHKKKKFWRENGSSFSLPAFDLVTTSPSDVIDRSFWPPKEFMKRRWSHHLLPVLQPWNYNFFKDLHWIKSST